MQGHVQTVGAVLGPVDVVTGLAEPLFQVLTCFGVIFDQQDMHRQARSGLLMTGFSPRHRYLGCAV